MDDQTSVPHGEGSAMDLPTSVPEGDGASAEGKTVVPRGAILQAWCDAEWDNGVQIDKMEELVVLAVQTEYSLYEITVLDGRRGEILVQGGQFFPERTPAHLAGASLGGSFLKMRGIYVGMKMEIGFQRRRIVTSYVKSIGVVT